ncbi:MAG: hypothetical protein ACI8QS_000008 [Planctomycetota bacterium]|jgi:hypothetical protein
MRTATLLLFASLTLPSIFLQTRVHQQDDGQEGGTPEVQEEEQNPFRRSGKEPKPSLMEEEALRLDKELPGAWVLTRYLRTDTIIPNEEVRGFAMFHDGFMTFNFEAVEDQEDFFLPEKQYIVQSGAFRYRIFEGRYLQAVGIQGFTNDNPTYELEFHSVKLPREYRITLEHNRLVLERNNGIGFEFRRLPTVPFPRSAVEQLRLQNTGFDLPDSYTPPTEFDDDKTP